MKNQLNRIYIFCTFRGQLLLFLAVISINFFNVATYVYTEGCDNLIGETVGLYTKLKEDPNFIPYRKTPQEKAYLLEEFYKERVIIWNNSKRLFIFNYNYIQETRPLSDFIDEIIASDLDINNKQI